MYEKKIVAEHNSRQLVSFAVQDEGEEHVPVLSGFTTEPNHMIMSVDTGSGRGWFSRLTRDEVVQMARFFAEAASKMPT